MQNFFLIIINLLLGICACGILAVGFEWFFFFKEKPTKYIILHLTGFLFFGTLFGIGFWTQRTIETGFAINQSIDEFEKMKRQCIKYQQDETTLEFKVEQFDLSSVYALQTWTEITNFLKKQSLDPLNMRITNLANQQAETLFLNPKTLQILKKSTIISCPKYP